MAKRPSDPDDETQDVTESGRTDLPLVALRETVIFPEMIVPLQVGREKSVNALNAAVAEGGPIALVTQRQAEQEDINDPSELYGIGTLAKIAQVVQLQDGTVRAIVQGQSRLRLNGFTQSEPYLRASIEELPDESPDGLEVQALMRTVQAQIEQYVANGAPVPPEAAVAARNISEPDHDLGRRHHHHEEGGDLAVEVAVLPGEGHERQVAGVQHQLDAHEHHDGVAAREDTHAADREEDRRQDDVLGHVTSSSVVAGAPALPDVSGIVAGSPIWRRTSSMSSASAGAERTVPRAASTRETDDSAAVPSGSRAGVSTALWRA